MISGKVRVSLEDGLGIIDFYPSNTVGIVYLHEGEIVTGTSYRKKLVKLRKVVRKKFDHNYFIQMIRSQKLLSAELLPWNRYKCIVTLAALDRGTKQLIRKRVEWLGESVCEINC